MIPRRRRAGFRGRVAALALAGLVGGVPVAAETLVIEGKTVHPAAGPPIANGVVVIEDGRITQVGPARAVRAPRGATRLRAEAVTPGLIDVHSSVGLSGAFNVGADQDQDEKTDPNQADLRALDAFNPNEPLLRYLLQYGVTLIQTGPGPANPIAGQAGLFRTQGRVADAMVVRFPSALVFNLGEQAKTTYGERKQFPSTRMGTAALLRRALNAAREFDRQRREAEAADDGEAAAPAPERDLKKEALARVVRGELPALFVARREDDLLTAIRIAREFDLRYLLAGATEAYLIAEQVRAAGAPVLVGPVMERLGSLETMNATYENPALLADAGVPIAIRSGFEGYVPKTRLVLFEAAVAAVNGLGFERALRAITIDAARILGVEEEYGSLEPGKVGDVVLYDGDPFEYTSHVEAVVADGVVVYRRQP